MSRSVLSGRALQCLLCSQCDTSVGTGRIWFGPRSYRNSCQQVYRLFWSDHASLLWVCLLSVLCILFGRLLRSRKPRCTGMQWRRWPSGPCLLANWNDSMAWHPVGQTHCHGLHDGPTSDTLAQPCSARATSSCQTGNGRTFQPKDFTKSMKRRRAKRLVQSTWLMTEKKYLR